MAKRLIIWGLLLGLTWASRPRNCCRYNEDKALCPDKESCVINANGAFHSSTLSQCNVLEDSVKDPNTQCGFNGEKSDETFDGLPNLPFKLDAYVFKDAFTAGDGLPGLEVVVDYDDVWSDLEFDLDGRCVKVVKGHAAFEANASFVYDCHVLFGADGQMILNRSGRVKEFAICVENSCGSFYFVVPEIAQIP